MYRFPVGITLGVLLGSTALLSPLAAAAQTAAAQGQAPQTPPTPPSQNQTGPDKTVSDKAGSATAESKAMGAYKAFFDARLAGLHAGLELTPDQAPLWGPVEAAIRDLATIHGEMKRGADDDQPTAALGQLKRMSARMIRCGQAMKALADATGPLLATLSDDQKERLPTLLEGLQPKKILAKAFDLSDQGKADFGGRDDGMSMHRHHHGADDDHGPRHGYDDEGPRGQSDGDYNDREGRGRGWHGGPDRRNDWNQDRDGGDDRSDDRHGSDREHHGDHYHSRNDEERT